jgi:hypothetical protein
MIFFKVAVSTFKKESRPQSEHANALKPYTPFVINLAFLFAGTKDTASNVPKIKLYFPQNSHFIFSFIVISHSTRAGCQIYQCVFAESRA